MRKIIIIGAIVVGLIIIGAASGHKSGPPAASGHVTPKVYNVVALDADTIRVYIDWTNTGSAPASDSCELNTTVNDQFGDLVNIHVNSTATNGNIAAGGTQNLYQDLGVDAGDATYVTPADVKLVGC